MMVIDVQNSRLVTVVHARTPLSPAIDTWHNGFHELADAFLADGLTKAGVAAEDVETVSRTAVFVVEGLLTHPLPDAQRRAIFELISRPR
ncbi:hypothetical protein GCM10009710_30610 [Aeromicrobium alkaliterrae]|uniref:TetR family transcriptional regulator n=2 Tax=Aeromicrobium alkaliterrae TaxID=302168 RepID=A0ABP4WA27_9ACTN